MNLASAFRAAPIYAIYDTRLCGHLPCAEVVSAWLRAGIRVIQYRHKGAFEWKNFAHCRESTRLAREAGAVLIVNDRADVALLAGAAGVHVGQDDLAPAEVRNLLPPPALVGHSTHNLNQLSTAASSPVDYLAIGPVFPTDSKENPDPVVGLELVSQARSSTKLPLVAIGGIDGGNLRAVLEAGADAVALISGLVSGCASMPEAEARARELLAFAATARA